MGDSEDEEEKMVKPDMTEFELVEDLTPYREFQTRPTVTQKFKATMAQEVILNVLQQLLEGKIYEDEDPEELIKSVAETIRSRLENRVYFRYKIIVHVELGSQKGAGLKSAARCIWDPETDSYATGFFVNDSLFCVATAFAVFFY